MKSFRKPAIFGQVSLQISKIAHCFLGVIFTVLLGCGAQSVSDLQDVKATEGFSPRETDKLFVVDCLLPGQIRKLGSQLTYLSARRPIKTTAGDCEIRGGEYVAYDRADTASALRVWLPRAQEGDAEAQVNVGEIYEKGPVGIADPVLAAQWYLKAAEKGNSRAQINLGYLYEKGLGVRQDKAAAINWYRKASGLARTDLQFATALEADYQKQIEELQEQSKGYKEEAENLRLQLETTRQQLEEQRQKSRTIQEQLDNSRNKLHQEKGKATRNERLIQSLQQEVEIKRSSLKSQNRQVLALEKKLNDELTQLNVAPRIQTVSKASKTTKIPTQSIQAAKEDQEREQHISQSHNRLNEMETRLKTLETEYHAHAAQISMDMNTIDEKSRQAGTTQEKLHIAALRGKLDQAKKNLSAQGRQIKELKHAMALERQNQEQFEKQPGIAVASAGPVIEMIDPPMTLTRGEPSYQLRSVTKNKAIMGRISSPSGLKSLEINQQRVPTDNEGVFKSEIVIDSASTPVSIVAIDQKNRQSVFRFNILTPSPAEPTEMEEARPATAVSGSYPSVRFGSYYALIIGNNDYTHLPTLKTSVNDAQAVNTILRTRYGYKTKLLLNASRHQIMTAFNALRQTLTDQDNLLIYYAGHGDIDKSDKSAYWLPIDAEVNNSANWLSSSNITDYLNVIPAKHILVIADSCYSGALTQGSIARLPNDMPENKREKWLNFMVNRKARTVLTSGGEEPVLDTGGGNHSVFANALLKALNSNKGLMVDYELYSRIASQVKKSASSIGFQQLPEYSALQHAGHEGSPFFFVPKS